MLKKWLAIGIILVFCFSVVEAKRLYTFGVAEDISLNTDLNSIHTFDSFDIFFKSDGLINIYKDGLHQGSIEFGFFATKIDSKESTLTKYISSEYFWTWEVLEDSSKKISIRGYNNNSDFKWYVDLNIERYKPLKFTHNIKNNSTILAIDNSYDFENVEMFYILDINQTTNPIAYLEKKDGDIEAFDFKSNVELTDKNTTFSDYYSKVSFSNFSFDFTDVVEADYNITKNYAGSLRDFDDKLSASNGFIIGIKKGDEKLGAGTSYEIDPTINLYSTSFDGFIRLDDDGYESYNQETEYQLTSMIWSGHDNISGIYNRMYFGSMFFLIGIDNSTPPDFNVSKAELILEYKSSSVSGDTCTFDLNSVDFGADETIATDDWRTTSFGIIVDDFADETTITNDQRLDITDAWNDSRQAGRGYLSFRISISDWNDGSYNNAANKCWVKYYDTIESASGEPPYIEYIPKPYVNVLQPNGNQYLGYINDGNSLIDFNVSSVDTNYLFVDIYYSETAIAFENLIIADLNLQLALQNPTDDINCTSDYNDFSDYIQCVYDFNFMSISTDGNYFIDINVHIANGDAYADSSDASFYVDSTNPSTKATRYDADWNASDQNILLSCQDVGIGVNTLFYSLNNWDWNAISDASFGVNIDTDGNWQIDLKCLDDLNNLSDINSDIYIPIDKIVPVNTNYTIDVNDSGTDQFPTFTSSWSDASSGFSKCGYIFYLNEVATEIGYITPVGNTCSYTYTTALQNNQRAGVDFNGIDNVENSSAYVDTAQYVYVTGSLGGGGGGGGTTLEEAHLFRITTLDGLMSIADVDLKTRQQVNIGQSKTFTIGVKNISASDYILNIHVSEEIAPYLSIEEEIFLRSNDENIIFFTLTIAPEFIVEQQFETIEGVIFFETISQIEEVDLAIIVLNPFSFQGAFEFLGTWEGILFAIFGLLIGFGLIIIPNLIQLKARGATTFFGLIIVLMISLFWGASLLG